ncbi:hypothetical protein RU639_001813 [Aspergillus parasiticus]
MLFEDFVIAWENSDHDRRLALFLALIKCIRWEIAKLAVPRLCLVIFNTAQPFLLSRTMVYFGSISSRLPRDTAGDLIRDSTIVFIGIAISNATNEHLGYRAMAMLRSGTTALVYHTMMWLHIDIAHESGAISLVVSDIDSVAEFVRHTVCDTWANALQLGLATWLLSTQIGAICIVPIIVASLGFASISLYIGGSVSRHQKSWLEATQKRVEFTTRVLGIQAARVSLVYLPLILGQLSAFTAYAIAARLEGSSVFSVSQAITSLSLINLLFTPLHDLLFAIPNNFSSIGCLDRVQDFLTRKSQNDKRMVGLTSSGLTPSLQPPVPLPRAPGNASLILRTAVLELDNVTIGTGPDHPKHIGRLTLRLSTPSLNMIVGPVGCGKSILLKTILGEIEPVEGNISISDPEVAYCSQSPWILNKSIRENIIAGSRCYDGEWYRSIIHACCLDNDLREMPVGDNTLIGRQGTNLSQGQKQRIAIARAVYARKPFAFFDDVLNGLDQVTARKVFDRVFSERGILRRIGCIVLFASHGVNHLPQADLVIAFGEDGLEMERPKNSREENIATGEIAAERRMTRVTANIEGHTRETNGLAIYATAVVWPKVDLLLGFLVIESGLGVLRYVWVTMWSESEDGVSNSRLGFWLGIYASIGLGEAAGLILAIGWMWFVIMPAASKSLHGVTLRAVMMTPISFLSRIETGNLVSRFSEDLGLIDKVLSCGVILLGFQALAAIAQCVCSDIAPITPARD